MITKKKDDNGKNIRVTTAGWNRIRKYCFKNNLKMGAFVEQSTIETISDKIKSKTNENKSRI